MGGTLTCVRGVPRSGWVSTACPLFVCGVGVESVVAGGMVRLGTLLGPEGTSAPVCGGGPRA
jgi:hypothetical protein